MLDIFKVCLLGECAAGKTAIRTRIDYNGYNQKYRFTQGCDFGRTTVKIGNSTLALSLWDVSGMEQYGRLLPSYTKSADYCIIVFDITAADCLQNVKKWVALIKKALGQISPPIALMGTKCDLLGSELSVSNEVRKFAADNHYPYYEVSAKTRENLSEAFKAIGSSILWNEMKNKPSIIDEFPILKESIKNNPLIMNEPLAFINEIENNPLIIHETPILKIDAEIKRLSRSWSLFDRTHLHKIENLQVLRSMLTERTESVAELVAEWAEEKLIVTNYGFFTKTVTRGDLILAHRDWLSWIFNKEAETASAEVVSSFCQP